LPQVNAYLAPSDEALAAVQSWLSSNNVTATASGASGDWLTATVPISKANDLLGASYETFQHLDSGKSYARTLSYSLPADVAAHIDAVHPATSFNHPLSIRPVLSLPQSKKKGSKKGGNKGGNKGSNSNSTSTADSCADTVTPSTRFSGLVLLSIDQSILSMPPDPLRHPGDCCDRVVE
jgi:tripeptidyl-peptidase-1